MARRNRLLICVAIAMALSAVLFSSTVEASPFSSEAVVAGTIEDMWLDDDGCFFEILIVWCEYPLSTLPGSDVCAEARFLNESDGSYDSMASSQGWRVGDSFNATLIHYGDERADVFSLLLSSKSSENFAEPLNFLERNPLVFYIFVIGAVFLAGVVVLRLVFKVKYGAKSVSGQHDYLRFLKRI